MHLSSPADDGELWQVGTGEGRGVLRNIKDIETLRVSKVHGDGRKSCDSWGNGFKVNEYYRRWYLRIKYIRQMTNNSSGYRLLADMSKEHNVL